MKTVTFTNDYHGTSTSCRPNAHGMLTASQVRRIRNRLCSASDCTCGQDALRTRGKQSHEIVPINDDDVQLVARRQR